MPYEIQSTSHPRIVHLRYYGNITQEDMGIDEALGLNNDKLMYILLDASEMSLRLPKNFINGAAESFFINKNLKHMALYTGSGTLDVLATTIATITQRRDKLSIHKSREQALKYLLDQIGAASVA
jgi:hypothetical protein